MSATAASADDPVAAAPAVRFGWSRPRRLMCYYMIGIGALVSVSGVAGFFGADPADFGNGVGSEFEVLGVGVVWMALAWWLLGASVTADATGIRTRALLVRFVPAAEIVDVSVATVPHGIYAPWPVAPYVHRRGGRPVKLTPMERLGALGAADRLDGECQELLAAVGVVPGAQVAAGAWTGTYQDPATGATVPQGAVVAARSRRLLAGVLSLALYVGVPVLGISTAASTDVAAIGQASVAWVLGYTVWAVMSWRAGQTPTLRLLGMRVWRQHDAQNAGWATMALRELVGVGAIVIFPILWPASVAMMLFGPQRQAFPDVVAGTLVLQDAPGSDGARTATG
jgi:RDD family